MKFIRLKDTYPNRIVATQYEPETMGLTETYDQWGQPISPEDAGACLTILSQAAVKCAEEYRQEQDSKKYTIGDMVCAYEDDVYDAIVENCIEDEDYTVSQETCYGFNYWNGRNWETVAVSYENGYYTGISEVSDEDADMYQLVLDDMVEEDGVYRYGDYTIRKVTDASDWADYVIE